MTTEPDGEKSGERWLPMREAAAELGISFSTVDRHRQQSRLPARRDRLGRWLVDVTAVTPGQIGEIRRQSELRYGPMRWQVEIDRLQRLVEFQQEQLRAASQREAALIEVIRRRADGS